MIKRITLLRRRDDITEQAFRRHWAEPHAQIAKGFEGLVRYNQNRIDDICWQRGPVKFEVGGIVELWFKSQDAVARNAYSDTSRALIEDEPRFLSGLTAMSAGESWISQPTQSTGKYIVLASSENPARLQQSLEALAASDAATPDIHVDKLAPSFTREALWSEPQPPNVAITVWCDNGAADSFVAAPDSRIAVLLDQQAEAATAYRVNELRIV